MHPPTLQHWQRTPFTMGRPAQISDAADPPRPPMQAGDLFIAAALVLASWATAAALALLVVQA